MPHQADFHDAHLRHWQDGELLFGHDRWANADQLYGLSAECGLKAVMLGSGMRVRRSDGAPEQSEHRQHVAELWPVFGAFVSGRIAGGYLHLLPHGNPFASWSIADRYAHGDHFSCTRVDQHRMAADKVRSMVQSAQQDGVL